MAFKSSQCWIILMTFRVISLSASSANFNAQYYWPLEGDLHDQTMNRRHGMAFQAEDGINILPVFVYSQELQRTVLNLTGSYFVDFGDFTGECFKDPSLCTQGLSLALQMKLAISLQVTTAIFTTRRCSSGIGIVFGATSGSYVLRIRYGSRRIWSVTISPQYIPMNQWFTLFFSWKKDSRLAVYIDGQERAQTSTVSSESRYSSSIPGNLTLGYIYSCSSPMTKAVGLFSRLAIWYALKDANVTSLIHAVSGSPPSSSSSEEKLPLQENSSLSTSLSPFTAATAPLLLSLSLSSSSTSSSPLLPASFSQYFKSEIETSIIDSEASSLSSLSSSLETAVVSSSYRIQVLASSPLYPESRTKTSIIARKTSSSSSFSLTLETEALSSLLLKSSFHFGVETKTSFTVQETWLSSSPSLAPSSISSLSSLTILTSSSLSPSLTSSLLLSSSSSISSMSSSSPIISTPFSPYPEVETTISSQSKLPSSLHPNVEAEISLLYQASTAPLSLPSSPSLLLSSSSLLLLASTLLFPRVQPETSATSKETSSSLSLSSSLLQPSFSPSSSALSASSLSAIFTAIHEISSLPSLLSLSSVSSQLSSSVSLASSLASSSVSSSFYSEVEIKASFAIQCTSSFSSPPPPPPSSSSFGEIATGLETSTTYAQELWTSQSAQQSIKSSLKYGLENSLIQVSPTVSKTNFSSVASCSTLSVSSSSNEMNSFILQTKLTTQPFATETTVTNIIKTYASSPQSVDIEPTSASQTLTARVISSMPMTMPPTTKITTDESTSQPIKRVSKDFQRILEVMNGTVPGTQNEVSSLSSMLSAASDKVLTPEEIKLSNYLLNTLIEAQISNNMIYSLVRANEVTEYLVKTTSNLFEEKQIQSWKVMNESSSVAARLINCMDRLGMVMSRSLEHVLKSAGASSIKISVEMKAMDMEIKTDRLKTFKGYIFQTKQMRNSSLNLPVTLKDYMHSKDVISFNSMAMYTISNLLTPKEKAKEISSIVLSNTILAGGKILRFTDLKDPVTMHFQHSKPVQKKQRLCSFLNESAAINSNDDIWSNKGCIVDKTSVKLTVCKCYHLTSFTLIVDAHGSYISISPTHRRILSIISMVGSWVTIGCCVFTLIGFCFARRKTRTIFIHTNLVIALMFVHVAFVISIWEKTVRAELACKAFAILLHFSLMAMFSWMFVEGLHLYVKLIQVFHKAKSRILYCFIGWGLPLITIIVLTVLYRDKYGVSDRYSICWVKASFIWVFTGAIVPIILGNTVVLMSVIMVLMKREKYKNTSEPLSRRKAKVTLKASAMLLPLLGITWIFGYFTISEETLVFMYIFNILNCFQGVFIFIGYCLLDEDIQKSFTKMICKDKEPMPSSARRKSTVHPERRQPTLHKMFRRGTRSSSVYVPGKKPSIGFSSSASKAQERKISNPGYIGSAVQVKQVTAADIEIHDMEQNFNNLNKLDDGDRGEVGRTNSGFSRSNVLPVLREEFSEHEKKREESPRKRKLGVAGIGMEKNRRESSFEMMFKKRQLRSSASSNTSRSSLSSGKSSKSSMVSNSSYSHTRVSRTLTL